MGKQSKSYIHTWASLALLALVLVAAVGACNEIEMGARQEHKTETHRSALIMGSLKQTAWGSTSVTIGGTSYGRLIGVATGGSNRQYPGGALWGYFTIPAVTSPDDCNEGNCLEQPAFDKTVAPEFDFISTENNMQWGMIQPNGVANTTTAQDGSGWTVNGIGINSALDWNNVRRVSKIIQYARNNGMKIKGHALLWMVDNWFDPGWVPPTPGYANNLNASKPCSDLKAKITDHIRTLANLDINSPCGTQPGSTGTCSGVLWKNAIEFWDVTNETVFLKSTKVNYCGGGNQIDGYKNVITYAFKEARRILGSSAKLIMNEGPTATRWGGDVQWKNIVAFANSAIAAGAPIDAIGIQAHFEQDLGYGETPTIWWEQLGQNGGATQTYRWFVDKLNYVARNTGRPVTLSELDVMLNTGTPSASRLDDQKWAFHQAAKACDNATFTDGTPACFGITLWNHVDKYSWLRFNNSNAKPHIWDENYNKKPAYEGIHEAINGTGIMENGDRKFSTTGAWTFTSGAGIGWSNDQLYAGGGGGANKATYTFSDIANGTYTVQATWNGGSNRTSNAVFTIDDGAGGNVATARVNQSNNPTANVTIQGVPFQTLTTVANTTTGTIRVVLSDANTVAGSTRVIADAIRLKATVINHVVD